MEVYLPFIFLSSLLLLVFGNDNNQLNIDLFQSKQLFSSLCKNFLECKDIPFIHTSRVKQYISIRKPFVFNDNGLINASKWNLWEWAQSRHPVLYDVLELSTSSTTTSTTIDSTGEATHISFNKSPGVFTMYDIEHPETLPSKFPHYKVKDELLLWNFLYDIYSTSNSNNLNNNNIFTHSNPSNPSRAQ
jgi:hypothetical protein